MKVSVVICTYSTERFDDFVEAVQSVLDQTYDSIELILVIDGNPEVFDRAQKKFSNNDGIILHYNDKNRGISFSRTKGAELGSGEVVAFIDDDAVAAPNWIEELVRVYKEQDAVAVGGRLNGKWIAGEPMYLPKEFYWLIGVTPRGFADDMDEVRNTYGSNLSFRRDVFLEAGGFDENTGLKADSNVQAHEAPVCLRVRENTGKGVIYNKNAVVFHKIFDYRTNISWLLARAFWQGYSKRIMELILQQDDGGKEDYLKQLFFNFVPLRFKNLLKSPSITKLTQLIMIFVFTSVVGFGYLYGLVKSKGEITDDDIRI